MKKKYLETQVPTQNLDYPKKSLPDPEAAIFAAELGECESVDLHGMSAEDAVRELDKALNHAFMQEDEVVKIIHGRGTQKLRYVVEDYLKNCSFVEKWRSSNNPAEAGGVTYAALAKKR